MATTISIDPKVRDRLRGYAAGVSYSEAIERLMDHVELDRFLAAFRHAVEDKDYAWEKIPWDDPVWD